MLTGQRCSSPAASGLRRLALPITAVTLLSASSPEPSKTSRLSHDPLAGAPGLDQVRMCWVGNIVPAGRSTSLGPRASAVVGRALSRRRLQGSLASRGTTRVACLVEAADLEAQLGVVARLPAREAHIVAEARPLVRFVPTKPSRCWLSQPSQSASAIRARGRPAPLSQVPRRSRTSGRVRGSAVRRRGARAERRGRRWPVPVVASAARRPSAASRRWRGMSGASPRRDAGLGGRRLGPTLRRMAPNNRGPDMTRPRLFVTRKLPEAVEARLQRDYDALLNPEDAALRRGRAARRWPRAWTAS